MHRRDVRISLPVLPRGIAGATAVWYTEKNERRRFVGRWYVYLLRCGDGTLYTGCTDDVERRLAAHQSGRGAKYTRSRLPVTLVYQEPCQDRSAALRREWSIKQMSRIQKLELIGREGRRT